MLHIRNIFLGASHILPKNTFEQNTIKRLKRE